MANSNTPLCDNDPDDFLQSKLEVWSPLCNYYFPDNVPFHLLWTLIMNYNIRSLPRHFESFTSQCLYPMSHPFHTITLHETKLTDNIQNLFHMYYTFSSNQTKSSGGLSIYINNKCNCIQKLNLLLLEESSDALFIEIINGEIYRRPKSNIAVFMEKV